MGRTVQGTTQGLVEDFVPDVDGNRADPEPVTITFRHPTEADRRRASSICSATVPMLGKKDDEPPGRSMDRLVAYRDALVRGQIDSVKNYFRETPAGDVPIETGADFSDYADPGMYDEAMDRIANLSALSERTKKKSGASSVSTPLTTGGQDGTAPSASLPVMTSGGTAGAAMAAGTYISPSSAPSSPSVQGPGLEETAPRPIKLPRTRSTA